MPKTWVIDASPLILLSRIERLDLLISLSTDLVVPLAVVEELDAGSHRDGALIRSSE